MSMYREIASGIALGRRGKILAGGAVVAGMLALGSVHSPILLAAPPAGQVEPAKPAAEADLVEKQKRLKAELEKIDKLPAAPNVGGLEELPLEMRKQLEDAFRQFQLNPFPGGPMILNGQAVPGVVRKTRSPRLGVQATSPTPELVDQLDLPKDQGVVIQDVVADSPAEKAGLKKHDILLEIAGRKVPTTLEGLIKLLDELESDKPLAMRVIRKGRTEKLEGLKLAKAEAPVAPQPVAPVPKGFMLGGNGGFNSMSVQVSNDDFTINANNNGQEFTLVGRKDGAAKSLSSIKIKDGAKSLSYDKLEDVPAEYKATVDKLLASVN